MLFINTFLLIVCKDKYITNSTDDRKRTEFYSCIFVVLEFMFIYVMIIYVIVLPVRYDNITEIM